MFSNAKLLNCLASQIVKTCELQTKFSNEHIFKNIYSFCRVKHKQDFHTHSPRSVKVRESQEIRRATKEAQQKDRGVAGAFSQDIDQELKRFKDYFPTKDLPDQLFDGIAFRDLPIVHIHVSRNNTILNLTDKGLTKYSRSCGHEGFKNARKGTNIASQTLGYSFGLRAVKMGYKLVRVLIRGLGPGRLSTMKGLQIGGINIVSVTDDTTDYTNLRPRKQRRL